MRRSVSNLPSFPPVSLSLLHGADPVREATVWITWFLLVGSMAFFVIVARERFHAVMPAPSCMRLRFCARAS